MSLCLSVRYLCVYFESEDLGKEHLFNRRRFPKSEFICVSFFLDVRRLLPESPVRDEIFSLFSSLM